MSPVWLPGLAVAVAVLSSSVISQHQPADPHSDPASSCQLQSKNISLHSKSQTKYFMAPHGNTTRLYLALCHRLTELPDHIKPLCDNNAFSCITKIDQDGREVEYVRNAGSSTAGLVFERLDDRHEGVRMNYEEGDSCVNSFNKTVTFSTYIDFLCSQGEDDNIFYAGLLDNCISQVYWNTQLACLPGQLEARPAGSCVVEIPGYDVTLDLASWAAPRHYTARPVPGDPHSAGYYQLNLCSGVRGGACTDNAIMCEVDDSLEQLTKNIIGDHPRRVASYNELTEVIQLEYYDKDKAAVHIGIECSRAEEELTMVSSAKKGELRKDGVPWKMDQYHFKMKTAKACFVPLVQCSAETQHNEVFNFEKLRTREWDFTLPDSTVKYQIKVCGSLPIMARELGHYSVYPCQQQTGICTFDDAEVNGTKAARSLGVMRTRPVYNEDGSISMKYEGGDTVSMKNNETCDLEAEIIFRCDPDDDKMPRLLASEECKHTLEWLTPEACPVQPVTSHTCTVQEPHYNHLFNMTSLHNDREDNVIKADNKTFYFNLCGELQGACPDADICLSSAASSVNLTYNTDLRMQLTSDTPCAAAGGAQNYSVDIVFLCHHDISVGAPVVLPSAGDWCHYSWEWSTSLACPPHDVRSCTIDAPDGEVDLSVLSRPDTNYQVPGEGGEGGKFVLNVCRSIVHAKNISCPYHSAACLIKTSRGQIGHENLGQVTEGLKVDPQDGNVYIQYKLGSACTNSSSKRSHIETTIYFDCAADVTDSLPELVSFADCLYTFRWSHAAACPVTRARHGDCRVTDPNTGFTFDLGSLRSEKKNYKWAGSYRHIKGQFEFNICGGLVDSQCGDGAGVCSTKDPGKLLNFGAGNKQLTIEDGQLYLNYTEGGACEDGGRRHAQINFNCPYVRNFTASGNYEPSKQKYSVQQQTKCFTLINFPTELACPHQVLCEVSRGEQVFSLTKLRRHQDNYHVPNTDPARPDFVLNICGPLVTADVNSSSCNPHSACALVDNEYMGFGKAEASPYVDENGSVTLEYSGGGRCNSRGDHGEEWQTKIVFTCNPGAATSEHPFGYPVHVSTDPHSCVHTFHFPTILTCNDTFATETVSEPDSCIIYHSAIQQYIDISPLVGAQPYIVKNPTSIWTTDQYEIQPCGRTVSSCRGSICHVTSDDVGGVKAVSLGHMTDFIYDSTMDHIKVDYKEGSLCNSISKMRWKAKIYYTCDPAAGLGHPVVNRDGIFNCAVWFDWRTNLTCTHHMGAPDFRPRLTTTPASVTKAVAVPDIPDNVPQHSQEPPVSGGSSTSSWLLLLAAVVAVAAGLVLYLKPEARERVFRVVQGTRARLPVWLGGRSREDTTLLVSDGRMTSSGFGAMSCDEEFA